MSSYKSPPSPQVISEPDNEDQSIWDSQEFNAVLAVFGKAIAHAFLEVQKRNLVEKQAEKTDQPKDDKGEGSRTIYKEK